MDFHFLCVLLEHMCWQILGEMYTVYTIDAVDDNKKCVTLFFGFERNQDTNEYIFLHKLLQFPIAIGNKHI